MYLSLSLYIYICICLYIYIYRERERERERCKCVYIYVPNFPAQILIIVGNLNKQHMQRSNKQQYIQSVNVINTYSRESDAPIANRARTHDASSRRWSPTARHQQIRCILHMCILIVIKVHGTMMLT